MWTYIVGEGTGLAGASAALLYYYFQAFGVAYSILVHVQVCVQMVTVGIFCLPCNLCVHVKNVWCVCLCLHMHVCVYANAYTCGVCIYVQYVHMHVFICLCMCTCVCTCVHVCMCVCAYTCVCAV